MANHDDDMGHDEDIDTGDDSAEAYEGDAMRAYEAEYGDRDDKDNGDDKEDTTTTAHTKDTTVDQSLSNYDNYKASNLSFDRIHTARRDANSAIGEYITRVAGYRQDKAARGVSTRGTDIRSIEELGTINRSNTLSFEDHIKEGAQGWASPQDRAVARRTDWESPSLVDEWGMSQLHSSSSRRALTDADLTQLTRQAQDAQIVASGTTPVVNAQALNITRVGEDAVRNRARQWESNEFARVEENRLAELESEQAKLAQAGNLIKQADAVIASPGTTTAEKSAAISDKNRLMMNQRRMRARQEYNAVTDPTASVYSKDVHTRVGFDKLNAYIASVAERQFFNTRWNYTKHDPATTMKVQKAIERYEDIYGSWLNDMGKRNSKAINAKGFDMSKGKGIMGINIIQGIFNKFNLSYHATNTEKMLRALRVKWELDEPDTGDGPNIVDLKRRCNEKSGWEWDEETDTCVEMSGDFNKDYRKYLP